MDLYVYGWALAELHSQDAVDGIEYSEYTYEMSNVGYVNII